MSDMVKTFINNNKPKRIYINMDLMEPESNNIGTSKKKLNKVAYIILIK